MFMDFYGLALNSLIFFKVTVIFNYIPFIDISDILTSVSTRVLQFSLTFKISVAVVVKWPRRTLNWPFCIAIYLCLKLVIQCHDRYLYLIKNPPGKYLFSN